MVFPLCSGITAAEKEEECVTWEEDIALGVINALPPVYLQLSLCFSLPDAVAPGYRTANPIIFECYWSCLNSGNDDGLNMCSF